MQCEWRVAGDQKARRLCDFWEESKKRWEEN